MNSWFLLGACSFALIITSASLHIFVSSFINRPYSSGSFKGLLLVAFGLYCMCLTELRLFYDNNMSTKNIYW